MDRITISCDRCERLWSVACSLSAYEQQALESRPCPHCGACTLACHDDAPRPPAAGWACSWHTDSF